MKRITLMILLALFMIQTSCEKDHAKEDEIRKLDIPELLSSCGMPYERVLKNLLSKGYVETKDSTNLGIPYLVAKDVDGGKDISIIISRQNNIVNAINLRNYKPNSPKLYEKELWLYYMHDLDSIYGVN